MAEQDSLRTESHRIERLIAATNNPALTQCVVFLGTYLDHAKRSILELSELQRRSLVYATLKTIQPRYSTATIAELESAQLRFNEVWTHSLDEKGGEAQNFDVTFVLNRRSNAPFFRALEEKGEAVFAIPFDHPEFNRGGISFVTVQEVDLTMAPLKSASNKVTCRLTHLGNSTLWDQSRQKLNFTHAKRVAILSYELRSGKWEPTFSKANNLRGSVDRYLFVSPFAGWHVWFSPDDRVDLKHINQIKVAFKAQGIPANSPSIGSTLMPMLKAF